MFEILNFDIKRSGQLSALPYLASLASTILAGVVSDALIKSGWMSSTGVRKTCTAIGKVNILIIMLVFLANSNN